MRGTLLAWLGGLVCAALMASVHAQDMRDPTAAPYTPASGTTAIASPLGAGGHSVVVRNGTPFLVVGTRLVGVGQHVGSAKLERITETEIWLRDSNGLQKIPRFDGIQRHTSAAPTTASACADTKMPPKKKGAPKPRAAASCGGTLP